MTARKDGHIYPTGRKVTDDELAAINLVRDSFHGEWNYTIKPQLVNAPKSRPFLRLQQAHVPPIMHIGTGVSWESRCPSEVSAEHAVHNPLATSHAASLTNTAEPESTRPEGAT